MPYIREGNRYIQSNSNLMMAVMNQSQIVYCDAFQPIDTFATSPEFDGLVWQIANNNTVVSKYLLKRSNSTYFIFTTPFEAYTGYNSSSNTLFQCCTTLNKVNVKCQASYVLIDQNYLNRVDRLIVSEFFLLASILTSFILFK